MYSLLLESFLFVICLSALCCGTWASPALTRADFKAVVTHGMNSDGHNDYAWGLAIDGDVAIIGSNRYMTNISFTGMVASGNIPIDSVMLDVSGSQYHMFTQEWANDCSAKIFRCTGARSGSLSCSAVLTSGTRCYTPGTAICSGLPALPTGGMATICIPESYGYRSVKRINGWWVVVGIGQIIGTGGNVKVWASTTGYSGQWIDITGNMDMLVSCGKYENPREQVEFKNELCLTVSKWPDTYTNKFYALETQMMCKPVSDIGNRNVNWVNRLPTAQFAESGNRDIFYLEKFPGFLNHGNALFAGLNNYGIHNVSEGGYQVWYTFGNLDSDGHYLWTQLIANGFGDAAAQLGMTLKYWNNYMYVGSATFMGLIMDPKGSVYGVGKGTELVRISKQGAVELIVGDTIPRIPTTAVPNTRGRPKSGLKAGYNWPFNAYTWQMEVYDNRLYIGTYDASSKFFTYGLNALSYFEQNSSAALAMIQNYLNNHPEFGSLVASDGRYVEDIINYFYSVAAGVSTGPYAPVVQYLELVSEILREVVFNGFVGFDMLYTEDGVNFNTITINGGLGVKNLVLPAPGNGAQVGIRRLVVANNRLFVGTASFYGDGFEVFVSTR